MIEASRLARLPGYAFKQLEDRHEELSQRGIDVISLGIGDPDLPTPPEVVESLARAARNPEHHRYPSYSGLKELRQEAARYYRERCGVELDPDREVIGLIGSKEGLAHAVWGLLNEGEVALVPDPAYPVYANQALMVGSTPYPLPLVPEKGFLPDLGSIPGEVLERARLMFLNYPNNPTGAVATEEFLKETVDLCRQHDILILYDAAYNDLYLKADPPMGLLEIPGAREVALEFHSLSKPFNMTGWRVGFALGNEEMVSALGRVKNQVDSGQFGAIQEAAVTALRLPERHLDELRATYRRRAEVAVSALAKMGIAVDIPPATFYVWGRVPQGYDSASFCLEILDQTAVIVTPGSAFGEAGEGFFRISLTVSDDRLKEAMNRLEKVSS